MQASKPQSTSESSPCSASTTCPYCGVGCGVSLELETRAQEGGELKRSITAVSGDNDHPA
ncbi:hypothetical protein, partial [Cobetia amphilecti]